MQATSHLHQKTPLVRITSPSDLSNSEIYFKFEQKQPTGSFKIRGIGRLFSEKKKAGMSAAVSSSGGNAGLACAFAGRKLGIETTVVLPKSTPEFMRKKISDFGAQVRVYGEVWDQAHEYALQLAQKDRTFYVHPFDNPLIWEGHSTIAPEVIREIGKPDAIVLAVGGGGLFQGVHQGLQRENSLSTEIIAVETEGAASLHAAINAGKHVTLSQINTKATSLGAKSVAKAAFETAIRFPTRSVVISDEKTFLACGRFRDEYGDLVEPACGAALAMVYDTEKRKILKQYPKIVVIVCGGTVITNELLEEYLRSIKPETSERN